MSDALAEIEFLTVEAFYALTMGVAEGPVDKAAVAAELERIARPKTLQP